MRGVLRKIINTISPASLSVLPGLDVSNRVTANSDSSSTITQAWFWPKVGEFLKENDIVITETGTSNFGIWETKFPKGVTALSQVLWGSIGYSVGATQGAALAARDAGDERRTVLFVGDGSFQLTAQELSTMIRLGLKPIMYLSPFFSPFSHSLLTDSPDLSSAMTASQSSASSTDSTPRTTISRPGPLETS